MGKASDLLAQILTQGPSQNTIFFALTKMKEEGLHSEIIQECLKALCLYPDDTRIRNMLAESYMDAGFIRLAEEELITVASEIEKLTSAYMLQARIYKCQNRPEKAMESLKKYLALNPEDQKALDLYGETASIETETPLEESPGEDVTEPEQLEAEPVEEIMEDEPETEPPETQVEETEEIELVEPEPEEEPLEEMAAFEPEEEERPEEDSSEIIEDETEVEEIEEEKEIVDLATPTLAELYFSQGQIQESIETYEKVLLDDPEDKESEQRLNELKASLDKEDEVLTPEESEEDLFREKTEKSISVLEGWLAQLQKKN